jgi:hypothetical protein
MASGRSSQSHLHETCDIEEMSHVKHLPSLSSAKPLIQNEKLLKGFCRSFPFKSAQWNKTSASADVSVAMSLGYRLLTVEACLQAISSEIFTGKPFRRKYLERDSWIV